MMLKIVSCSDKLMWYSKLVGKVVPYLGVWEGDGYKSREPAGYVNVVRFKDAIIGPWKIE